ncbi:MAG: heme exporter protein CcmD [Pseudomonadota bacterium]|nr:heme exporter protein CcmD [Pseudomonadota bacterium]MEC7656981.1 heme exporter protein CcmD [Pseudomonadota bacterium]MEC8198401.1 heme exporter protein CcmD [Pseudomonadota bacterium]MEC8204779.1 heme exporter protein CcmD [Pseudomonadota bacterium]MEC8777082.1 heme exporter protein CcmD [Pseudomonadota bacterium]
MNDFLDMGGYAAFIWPAYLIAAVILGGILAQTIITMRRRERLADTLRLQRRGGFDEDEA